MNKKAIIAMSGGVDSSVAAYLMKQRGYECVGVTMKLFQGEDVEVSDAHSCCSLDDVKDAESVAKQLGMPYHVFGFSDLFRETVIDKFVEAYENGCTPNPCINCNRFLKFNKLYHRALELGCDYVVTGHYARIECDKNSGRYILKKGLDPTKDQSYVLYSLSQEQLAHTIFPLGELNKTDARAIAREQGFVSAHKHDSQDLCFVKDGDYAQFIETYTGKTFPRGSFIDTKGNILGEHKGIIHYTVGQRKGLGIAFGEPMFVCGINPKDNTVTLGKNSDLYTDTLTAGDINLISVPSIDAPIRVKAKVRYRQVEQWATVTQLDEETIRVKFDEPQRAITKGQAVVLYDGDTVVGGGTIIEV